MALFVHNTGVFSKLYSEAVEAIDPRPVEGIRATGARRIPEIVFGVIPQVIPLWSSFILYRLETNVRSATTSVSSARAASGRRFTKAYRHFTTPTWLRKCLSSSQQSALSIWKAPDCVAPWCSYR
jgi:phosphonate transport system permease protein